jgi:hypothetical protein
MVAWRQRPDSAHAIMNLKRPLSAHLGAALSARL